MLRNRNTVYLTLLRALKPTEYTYPVPVDPDPAEEIEHIEDFRDPSEDGDEGGV